MFLKQFIRSEILKQVTTADFSVEIPKNQDNGDYASNVAFLLAKKLKKNPVELANSISQKLSNKDIQSYNIGPFINFKLSDLFLFSEILKIDHNYGKATSERKEKILLEYVSANPTGPLHIGHGRWAVIGDVLKRLLLYSGFKVSSEFYINDAGNQIKNLLASVTAAKQGQPIPDDGYHGKYIFGLAASGKDPVQVMISQQKDTLKKLNINFDTWFSEKQLHESKSVENIYEYLDTYQKDGALWFRSTAYGDDKDRVLIKASGEPTYFAVDIAYHYNKIKRGYQLLINILGADHHGYINRLKNAIASQLEENRAKLEIIIGQMVSLFRGKEPIKMSKRTGEMITLNEVMTEIGVDATRYFLIRRSPDTHVDFDLELAKQETLENPVFYVQYAHARISSIIRTAVEKYSLAIVAQNVDISDESLKLNSYERLLAKKLLEFPDEVSETALAYQPHRLAIYAEELAAIFHSFYQNCRVLTDDIKESQRRLCFVKATKTVLQIILKDILGISAPEKM